MPLFPNCSDLLTPEENQEIVSKFDQFDKNNDGEVTKDEYMKGLKHMYATRFIEAPPSDETLLRECEFWFKFRDNDGNGTVDWFEFLEYEALFQLEKRGKPALVKLLTDEEKQSLRQQFDSLDKDHNGNVTTEEASSALEERYQPFVSSGKFTVAQKKQFIRRQIGELKDADADFNGEVDFQEFLNANAMMTIASRSQRDNAAAKLAKGLGF